MGGEDQGRGLGEIEIKAAMRLPGCPICRVKWQAANRYIDSLLWEGVNDTGTRMHIVRGFGYCAEHTWQLYHREMCRFGDELGTSIIYADLARHTATALDGFRTARAYRLIHWRWLDAVWYCLDRLLGRLATRAYKLNCILPSEECRVCSLSRQSEQYAICVLLAQCSHASFRDRYNASDGVCLAHLRQTLEQAARDDPHVARWLVESTTNRLLLLATDLSEYARKQSWQYRNEATTESEKDAPRRASQFFGGPEKEQSRAQAT